LRDGEGLDHVVVWLEEKLYQPPNARRPLIDAHAPYTAHRHEHTHDHSHDRGHEPNYTHADGPGDDHSHAHGAGHD